MKHEADIRSAMEREPIRVAVERARASYSAGKGVEHRVVSLWLRTWGKPGRLPFEEWLADWDG